MEKIETKLSSLLCQSKSRFKKVYAFGPGDVRRHKNVSTMSKEISKKMKKMAK
jgi:hypothetical protein